MSTREEYDEAFRNAHRTFETDGGTCTVTLTDIRPLCFSVTTTGHGMYLDDLFTLASIVRELGKTIPLYPD